MRAFGASRCDILKQLHDRRCKTGAPLLREDLATREGQHTGLFRAFDRQVREPSRLACRKRVIKNDQIIAGVLQPSSGIRCGFGTGGAVPHRFERITKHGAEGGVGLGDQAAHRVILSGRGFKQGRLSPHTIHVKIELR